MGFSPMSRDLTPSPSTAVQTPPAPRHGFHDRYQPFVPTRFRDARVTFDEPRILSRTPSPPASYRQPRPPFLHPMAGMASPEPTPLKRRQPASEPGYPSARDFLSPQSAAKTAASLGLQHGTERSMEKNKSSYSTLQSMATLPTPAKTPQKPVCDEKEARIHDFAARKLFQSKGSTGPETRKRRPIRYEMTASDNDEVEIFTDQENAVPTKDLDLDNPFYGKKMSARPINRKGHGNMVSVAGEGAQAVEEVAKRTDGMIFIFRGKKIFRKFADCEGDQETSDSEYDSQSVDDPKSPLKRVLFPPKQRNEEEEEAVTDVEVMYSEDDDDDEDEEDEEIEEIEGDGDEEEMGEVGNVEPPETPIKFNSILVKTPDAPKFGPVSPPSTKQTRTKRTTRSTHKLSSNSSSQGSRSGRDSPFDSWQRTKENKGVPLEKRSGEGLTHVTTKRSRA